jgi:hypothetical protein
MFVIAFAVMLPHVICCLFTPIRRIVTTQVKDMMSIIIWDQKTSKINMKLIAELLRLELPLGVVREDRGGSGLSYLHCS